MKRGPKFASVQRCCLFMIQLSDFPDEEGTEGTVFPAWTFAGLLSDFPDEEGTEGSWRPCTPAPAAPLSDFPDEEGTEGRSSGVRSGTPCWAAHLLSDFPDEEGTEASRRC